GFENAFALIARGDEPAHTISAAVPRAPAWRAGFGYEFSERPDGYPGLARTYGLAFRQVRIMDLGLLYRALVQRDVDVVAGNSTDGLIDQLHLNVLDDDRHFFPPYDAVPVVRRASLEQHASLGPALDRLG